MRNALFILGALLVAGGVLMAAGLFKYQDTDKVAEFGKLEIEASREKTAPVNWGYVLLGGGVVVLVGAALVKKL
jgi:hypothetical protein